jgi:hypothetical protein
MEINDKILLHKVLSTDKKSKYFQIILTNKSTVELWKVPKMAFYTVIAMIALQLVISALWIADIKPPILQSLATSKSTLSQSQSLSLSPERIQKVTQLIEGTTTVKEWTIEDKKDAFLFSLILTTPILEDNSNLVQLRFVNHQGEFTTPKAKAKAIWKPNAISAQGQDSSTIKILISKSEFQKKSTQTLNLTALENQKLIFRINLDLEQIKSLLSQGKTLSQANGSQIYKK